MISEKARTFINSLSKLPDIMAFIEGESESAGFETKRKSRMLLAAEEALVNIVRYAYDKSGANEITVRTVSTAGRFTLTLDDSGVPFDPTAKHLADNPPELKDMPIGGKGVAMMKLFADELRYVRENGRNVFTLVFLS